MRLTERERDMVLDELAKYNLAVEMLKHGDFTQGIQITERVQTSAIGDSTVASAIRVEQLRLHVELVEDIVSGFRPAECEFVRRKYMSGSVWPADEQVRKGMKIGLKRFYEIKETALWDLKCELNMRLKAF